MYATTLTIALVLAAGQPPGPRRLPAELLRPDPAWKELGQSLWFDPGGTRPSSGPGWCSARAPLEHLMCLKGTKEHEAILATDAVPRRIHAGLLLTGADVGHPVQFVPKFEPPSGSPIAIELRWHRTVNPGGRRPRLGLGREDQGPADDRLGLRRQRHLRGPGHQETGLRRRRGRPDHRRQLRQLDPRPPDGELRE